MTMQFYKRYPLPSGQMKIIDLNKNQSDPVKAKRKQTTFIRSLTKFEFKTRADRDSMHLAEENKNTDNGMLTQFETDLSHINNHTDNSMLRMDGGDQQFNVTEMSDDASIDPMEAENVQPMDVYNDLQDPEKRLVLTNIRQFHEEEQEDKSKDPLQQLLVARQK